MKKLFVLCLVIFLVPLNLLATDHEQIDGLYYFIEPVTDKNRPIWKQFSEEVGIKADTPDMAAALAGFRAGTAPDIERNYVVYATTSSTPLITLDEMKKNLLIAVTATNCGTSNAHYGIFRNPFFEGPEYRRLSLTLHGFAAKMMQKKYPKAVYTIVPPIQSMADIIAKSGLKAGEDYQVFNAESPPPECSAATTQWLCRDKGVFYYRILHDLDGGKTEAIKADEDNPNTIYVKFQFLNQATSSSISSPGLYVIKGESLQKILQK